MASNDSKNGFFGCIQGPFIEDPSQGSNILTLIQNQCRDDIQFDHISKIGIHCPGNYDLDLSGAATPQIFIRIDGKEFQIGKTRMLELQDVEIRNEIVFLQNMPQSTYIDYQYQSVLLQEEE